MSLFKPFLRRRGGAFLIITVVLYDWYLQFHFHRRTFSEKINFSWEVGIEPSSTSLLGFRGSIGSNDNEPNSDHQSPLVFVCVFLFLPIFSGRQVRWMYQPGSQRKVTQDF